MVFTQTLPLEEEEVVHQVVWEAPFPWVLLLILLWNRQARIPTEYQGDIDIPKLFDKTSSFQQPGTKPWVPRSKPTTSQLWRAKPPSQLRRSTGPARPTHPNTT